MAVINGMYIHVVDETVDKGVETPSHPVEEGIGTTDLIRVNPVTLALSGKIVDYSDMKSHEVLAKINSLMRTGSLVSYRGRNVFSNMIIRSFSTSHPNTNSGGADFDMELQEVRIAKSAYATKTPTGTNVPTEPTTNAGTQQIDVGSMTAVYYTVKKGDTVWSLCQTYNKDYLRGRMGIVERETDFNFVEWVIASNPQAFSVFGDANSLKIGARLLMGYRS